MSAPGADAPPYEPQSGPPESVLDLRRKGVALIAVASWIVVFALALMALVFGAVAFQAATVSALVCLIPTWAAVKGDCSSRTRLLLGLTAGIQPALLIYAMQGNIWQLDSHLYVMLALALLIPLCDVRSIIAASAIVVLHQGVLVFVMPQWAYFGEGGTARFLLHTSAYLAGATVFYWTTELLTHSLMRIKALETKAAKQAETIKDNNNRLIAADDQMKDQQEEAQAEKARIIAASKSANERIAAEFEHSVNAVAHSVAGTAEMLERSARNLNVIAQDAGEEARNVVTGAESTGRAANTVAAGVAELAVSISEIAYKVSKQSELAQDANLRSDGGGKAIGSLSQQSKTIGEATRAIVRIAERTNLLSLNAAIEAASASEAGRGFSIVAHEVKSLAGQASQAASEIDTFLKGVQSGTLEAERSFQAIDSAISELGETASSIRYGMGNQVQSADTIEQFARNAAGEADQMIERTKALAERADQARQLSDELDKAASALSETVRNLERSTESFTSSLKAA